MARHSAKVAEGERRYPGVASFEDTEVHRMLFYGRTDEIYDLQHLVLAERLVVLFSRSGIGKTSIINAGLMQPLRDAGQFPIVVRVNSADDDPFDSFYKGIVAACNRGVESGQIDSFEPDDPKDWNTSSLWHFFKTLCLWRDDKLLSPVLIIDQFEELFTLISRTPRQEFIDQLADLVRGTRPKTLRPEDTDLGERPPDVKVVLSIREDFMANLEDMAERIPAILNVRFRLSALDPDQARLAIVEPSQLENPEITTPPFRWAEDALNCTLDFLRKRKASSGESELGRSVEPFQLQLICQYVEDYVLREGIDVVTLEGMGGESVLEGILSRFYRDSIDTICREFPVRGLRRRIGKLFEYGFITPKGRRLLREESTINESNRVSTEVLTRMVQLRLIRKEPRVGDNYYELSHDTLIAPILASRETRERRRRRSAWAVGSFSAAAILIAFGLTLKSEQQQKLTAMSEARANELVIEAQGLADGSGMGVVSAHLTALRSLSLDDTEAGRDIFEETIRLLPYDLGPQQWIGSTVQMADFSGTGNHLIAVGAGNELLVGGFDQAATPDGWAEAGAITSVAISDSGDLFATATNSSSGPAIQVANATSGDLLVTLTRPSPVLAMSFAGSAPDDPGLIVADANVVQTLDVVSGRPVDDSVVSFPSSAIDIASVTGDVAAATLDSGVVQTWRQSDISNTLRECIFPPISALTLSRNGRLLAVASDDATGNYNGTQIGCLRLREVYEFEGVYEGSADESGNGEDEESGACDVSATSTIRVFRNEPDERGMISEVGRVGLAGCVTAVSLQQTGDVGLSAVTSDGSIQRWDLRIPFRVSDFVGGSGSGLPRIDAGGTRLLYQGGDGVPHLWDIPERKELTSVAATGFVAAFAFSPDGSVLVTAGEQGALRVWDSSSGNELEALNVDDGVAYWITDSDASSILTLSQSDRLEVWDRSSGGPPIQLSDGEAFGEVQMNGDGSRVAASTYGGTVRIWNAMNGQALGEWQHKTDFVAMLFSGDGSRLISAGMNGEAVLANAESGTAIDRWRTGEDLPIYAFSDDGSRLILAGSDGTVQIRDSQDGRLLKELPKNTWIDDLTISRDGSLLAARTYSSVQIWDADRAEEVFGWQHDDQVLTVTFSDSGRYVASAGYDGVLQVWDTEQREQRVRIEEASLVSDVVFLNDESEIIVVFDDGTTRTERIGEVVPATELVATGCARLARIVDWARWPVASEAKDFDNLCGDD